MQSPSGTSEFVGLKYKLLEVKTGVTGMDLDTQAHRSLVFV